VALGHSEMDCKVLGKSKMIYWPIYEDEFGARVCQAKPVYASAKPICVVHDMDLLSGDCNSGSRNIMRTLSSSPKNNIYSKHLYNLVGSRK